MLILKSNIAAVACILVDINGAVIPTLNMPCLQVVSVIISFCKLQRQSMVGSLAFLPAPRQTPVPSGDEGSTHSTSASPKVSWIA